MASDPNSSANFTSFLSTHLHLNLSINFSIKILKGFVEISFKKLEKSDLIVLDAANILVKSVNHNDLKIPVRLIRVK
jgi:aminopeptidase N